MTTEILTVASFQWPNKEKIFQGGNFFIFKPSELRMSAPEDLINSPKKVKEKLAAKKHIAIFLKSDINVPKSWQNYYLIIGKPRQDKSGDFIFEILSFKEDEGWRRSTEPIWTFDEEFDRIVIFDSN